MYIEELLEVAIGLVFVWLGLALALSTFMPMRSARMRPDALCLMPCVTYTSIWSGSRYATT